MRLKVGTESDLKQYEHVLIKEIKSNTGNVLFFGCSVYAFNSNFKARRHIYLDIYVIQLIFFKVKTE